MLVGTPIGNLGDLSPRAAETLAGADLLCCEDTRRTGRLLSAAGIAAPRLVALHDHNEASMADEIVRRAAGGATVAVATDAGMPGISDPGERVVRAAAAAGVAVDVVPGPSALVAALVVSGLPTERFVFEGFLPRKGSVRGGRLDEVASERRTTVLYEAPHRAERTLADLAERCGAERPVAIARELTKLHQEVWRGTLGQAVEWCREHQPRGEWVIVCAGAPLADPSDCTDADIVAALTVALGSGRDRRAAVADVTSDLGVPKRRVYDLAVGMRRRLGG